MVFRRYVRCKATLAEVIVAFFVLLAVHAYADTTDGQPTNNHVFSESGVFIGYGTGKIPEGHYEDESMKKTVVPLLRKRQTRKLCQAPSK